MNLADFDPIANFDPTAREGSPLIGSLSETAGLLQNLSTQPQEIGSLGDSWIEAFVQRSEHGFSASTVPANTTGTVEAVGTVDVITGSLVEADASSVPAYPGYLLSYRPELISESSPAVSQATSQAILQWQAQMQRRGWRIEVDGLFGPKSDRVARQFQQEKGLTVDGIVGPATWRAAFDNSTITGPEATIPDERIEDIPEIIPPTSTPVSNPPAYSGMQFSYSPATALRYSADVQTFQQRLQDLGWRIDADGLFGPNSASATKAFQQQVGLDPDGIVGPLTWAALFSEAAPAAPAEQTFTNPTGIRPISQAGLNLIRDFEGRRLNAYQDAVGVWTIGYGHTRTAYPGQRITEAGAVALLREDIATFERAVSQAVQVPLTDNQYAALVSFAFNVGSGALNSSTLLRRLNAGDYYGAANELLRWNRAGGRELYGLTRRREAERSLFLS